MAEAGTVTTHARTMSRTVVQRTALTPFNSPIPMIAELLMCVVETGNPITAETNTREEVVRFADNPSL